jgi:hypothetical protein
MRLLTLGLVALFLAAPGVSRAQDFAPQYAKGVEQYHDLDYETALATFKQAETLAHGHSEKAQVMVMEGVIYTELNRDSDGQAAFAKALSLKSDVHLPDGVSPKVTTAFASAKTKAKTTATAAAGHETQKKTKVAASSSSSEGSASAPAAASTATSPAPAPKPAASTEVASSSPPASPRAAAAPAPSSTPPAQQKVASAPKSTASAPASQPVASAPKSAPASQPAASAPKSAPAPQPVAAASTPAASAPATTPASSSTASPAVYKSESAPVVVASSDAPVKSPAAANNTQQARLAPSDTGGDSSQALNVSGSASGESFAMKTWRRHRIPVVLGATAVAATLVGAIFGGVGAGQKTGPTSEISVSAAPNNNATAANVCFSVAGAAAIGAVATWFLLPPPPEGT